MTETAPSCQCIQEHFWKTQVSHLENLSSEDTWFYDEGFELTLKQHCHNFQCKQSLYPCTIVTVENNCWKPTIK